MEEVIRFALLGLRHRGAVRARLAGPDRHLPRFRRPQLRARRDRHGRRLSSGGSCTTNARLGVPAVGLSSASCSPPRSARSTHLFVMRPLRTASPLVRVIATLGRAHHAAVDRGAALQARPRSSSAASCRPTSSTISGAIVISADRLILLGIAAVLHARALGCCYRYTSSASHHARWPRTSAPASAARLVAGPHRDASTGRSAAALAGLAAILIAPIVTLQAAVLTNLVLAATAAALVAGFRSFPIALVAGLLDRHRPDGAQPLRQPARRRHGGAVHRHRRLLVVTRPGAAAARLLPAAAADGRQRPDQLAVASAFGAVAGVFLLVGPRRRSGWTRSR